ncbi:MAG: hypothetical protein R2862_02870 [Thermoanaerobaculia bacterium]
MLSPAASLAASRSILCATRSSWRSPSPCSPETAAKVANGFADAYIDWWIENRTRVAGKTSTFFAAQIDTLKQEIQDKENQLQAYSRRTDTSSPRPGDQRHAAATRGAEPGLHQRGLGEDQP